MSKKRYLQDVDELELRAAVGRMVKDLGLAAGSLGTQYDLYRAVLDERQKAIKAVAEAKEFARSLRRSR
jgi:hypothetical protein